MLTIEHLPDEVVVLAFSYLSLRDRKNARLVNKQWLDLSNSASVVKDDIVVVPRHSELDECTIRRRNFNLLFKADKNISTQKFWKEHGCFVKSIEMKPFQTLSSLILDIIDYCPNIQHLSFFGQDFNQKETIDTASEVDDRHVKLENLLSLEIRSKNFTSVAEFFALTGELPKLERIRLEFRRCVDSDTSVKKAIELLVMRQAHTLKQLYFSNCKFLNEQFLKCLVQHLGPQVTSLHLPGCSVSTNQSTEIIANKFSNFEELDFSFSSSLTSHDIMSVLFTLKNLKLISLIGNQVNDEVFACIACLKHLRGLDLTGCRNLTAEGILNAFKEQHLKLFDLRLTYNSNVTDEVLEGLLPQLPNLKCLYLNDCSISTKGISAIVNNCKLLRCLSLRNCNKIENLIEPVSINGLKGLKYLNLQHCRGLKDDTISSIKFLELETVDFCYTVVAPSEDEWQTSLNANCPSLQSVYIVKECKAICYKVLTFKSMRFWRPVRPRSIKYDSFF